MNQNAQVPANKTSSRSAKMAIRIAVAAAALVSLPAFATLGGNVDSVTADKVALQASMTTSSQSDYTDYALTLSNGIIVHEFVNSANQVFEVTWNGKGMRPDMKQILGRYITRFGPQEKELRPTARHADRVQSDVEIHSAVQNRLFSGTAHIPAMIPSSMSGPLSVPVENAPSSTVATPSNGAH